MTLLTALGVAVAALNVALTLYHWRITRRARRHLEASRRHELDATRTLEATRAIYAGAYLRSYNGHGEAPPKVDE